MSAHEFGKLGGPIPPEPPLLNPIPVKYEEVDEPTNPPDWKQTIFISLKEDCCKDTMRGKDGCRENIAKLNELLDPRTRPFFHDTEIVLTLHQDWMGSSWHLSKVEYGQYEPFKEEKKE